MKPTLVRLALVFWHRSLYKVFQRRKTMQGHDIQITTTELNPSSSGFQFPLCFHSVLIWTISFHSGFFQIVICTEDTSFEQKLRQFEILEMYAGIVCWRRFFCYWLPPRNLTTPLVVFSSFYVWIWTLLFHSICLL